MLTKSSKHGLGRGSAESLVEKVLEEEGLRKYVDAKYLQQEIKEATDMTQEDLDRAAHELIRSSVHGALRQPYIEQLGGYKSQEMKDLNQYPSRGAPPARQLQRQPHLQQQGYMGDEFQDSMDDKM